MPAAKRFEESDFADDSVAVEVTPSGRAVVWPASVKRLSGEALAAVEELQGMGYEIAAAEALAREAAVEARELGVSWAIIGWCLGFTGEGARRRYGSAD